MKTLQPELLQAAHELGNAIAQTDPLREYREATDRMAADPRATALLDELQEVQAAFRVRQNDGPVRADELERLRTLQSEVKSHPTIASFFDAQLRAQAYLPSINGELSDLLGLDFASFGRVSSCC